MGTKERQIAEVALFREAPAKDIAWLAKVADALDVGAGSTLALEGKPVREFIVVIDGVASGSNGSADVVFRPGSCIGHVGLLDHSAHPLTVTARTSMRLLVFEARAFRGMLERIPAAARTLMSSITEQLRALDEELVSVETAS